MRRRITGRIMSIITAAALMAGGICMPAAASENQPPASVEETVSDKEQGGEEVIAAEPDEVSKEADGTIVSADENEEDPAEINDDDTEQDPAQPGTETEDDTSETILPETEEIGDFEALADSDELFSEYVTNVFGIGNTGRASSKKLRAVKTAYSKLSDFGKFLYDKLHEKTSAIANGDETSTQFTVNTSAECEYYTAAELGVEKLVVNNRVDPDAQKALFGKYGYNLGAVFNALILDCPYELYWYNKEAGTSVQYAFSDTYKNGEYAIKLSAVIIKMKVSQDYQASETDLYTTDENRTKAASKAAANARKVVKDNMNRADFEKLIVYKEYILDAVTYNTDATGGGLPYGDPWQLIYVFDNNPSTNVVCEGYSKAFQYLCDQSAFKNGYRSICVTGYLSASDGSIGERHEWNIVSAYGNNYLVDLTNCDAGTEGAPAELFMTGMNGNVSEHYSKEISQTVYYQYDTNMSDFYDESDLELSGSDFVDPEGWYDLSTYRTGETFTYPGKEGEIFAGWFTDSENSTPVEETVKKGPGHAKFVDEKTIGTVYQVNTGDPDKSKLRMYSSVDSLQYAYVGFHLKKSKTGDQVTTQKFTKVFTSYTSGQYTITPEEYFCQDSRYLVILTLNGIPTGQNNTVTFQPFWITLDGTEVCGAEKTAQLP